MNKSVFGVAFVAFASLVFAVPDAKLDEMSSKFIPSVAKCASSVGITQNEATEFFKSANKTVSNNVGCFFSCMGKEYGVVNDKHLFEKDKILKLVETLKSEDSFIKEDFEKGKQIVLQCVDDQKADPDPCVIGKTMVQCIISNSEKAGMKLSK